MPSIEIKIKATLWDALSVDEKDKITEIMKKMNSLDKGGSIVADPSAPDADAQGFFDDFIERIDPYKVGCDVAASAAEAACTAGTSGVGLAACLAAAQAARNACRSAC